MIIEATNCNNIIPFIVNKLPLLDVRKPSNIKEIVISYNIYIYTNKANTVLRFKLILESI
jgi:hypothetical protein